MSSKEITTYSSADGQASTHSVKQAPLTKNAVLDDARGFDMVCGDGYAMPIMRGRSG